MLAGQFVGGVDLLVARPAQRRLVRAAQHLGLRHLARIAQYLHLSLQKTEAFWEKRIVAFSTAELLREKTESFESRNARRKDGDVGLRRQTDYWLCH